MKLEYSQTPYTKINAGEGVEQREPFYAIDGNVNWYSGEQYGGSLDS